MHAGTLSNISTVDFIQSDFYTHTTHRHAPFPEKVLFLCSNNPKQQQ